MAGSKFHVYEKIYHLAISKVTSRLIKSVSEGSPGFDLPSTAELDHKSSRSCLNALGRFSEFSNIIRLISFSFFHNFKPA